ncbi:F-box/kelch-repeat protein At3g23880-like [Lycium ferocissimum]|uniref:F-box/kelch-repeat protein At3g23880-like n=1 Tax=Lycium ferocissimum TaxID=112874 RepID=UPI0028156DDF|nr:F-box/kelch-repeat protein At3g23880-like [Lycium ferocissimum]
MESEDPKRNKPTNHSYTSIQKSSLKIPVLPAELITEILLNLPVKSLLKFRCVSKSWLSLISSPKFIKTHLSICANNKACTHHRLILSLVQPVYKRSLIYDLMDCSLSTLLYDSVTKAFDLDYPMKDPQKSFEVVGSVNGLICFTIEQQDLFLWNPSIRKIKKLPDFIPKLNFGYSIMHGFGYDEVHDDYKVVAVSGASSYDISHQVEVEVKIYSVNSDSWRSIHDFNTGWKFIRWGMFVNGKLHWAGTTSEKFDSYNGWDIQSIDLADGKLGKVDKPCYGEGDFDLEMCLGVLGSDLSVFCSYQRTQTDVWVMKEYGIKESWTKMCIIKYPNDIVGSLLYAPFCMSSEGEILLEVGSTFIIYNPKDDSIRYPKVTNCDSFYWKNTYIESLVWPIFTE